MFNFSKNERIFLSGIIIGSIVGSLSAALAFFFNTQAVIKGSVRNNIEKEKTEPAVEPAASETKPKRSRKKKAEVEAGNAVTE